MSAYVFILQLIHDDRANKPITVKEAAERMAMLKADGVDVPRIDPEDFARIYNDIIDEEV